MKILVGYATKEGQSRKIARWIADRAADAGHSSELLALDDADGLEMARFDRAVLVASIHVGQFKPALAEFAAAHAGWLGAHPTLFLPVSLAAAGHDSDDWRALAKIEQDLAQATGWTPSRVEHTAGAYTPSRYDMLTRFIMRRIVAKKDPDADLDVDHEYTDWADLGRVVDSWLEA
ncbi:flavodoxin domain-containing protein [Roseibaca sp. Y0-43]|uniref:flavodoxin domain-containing protein n=1 Tax=Roseibaca sp. Y0-43 TaxID=2816854 RepID=UPI001D0C9784|nr:flavodoxin domain-containing protein [Roseibaca sp. Y0-43]MCC1481935.1 protoporphyrinogen oxidase [Roseibaca sp. Y0-43]